jgi:hypothetical protein
MVKCISKTALILSIVLFASISCTKKLEPTTRDLLIGKWVATSWNGESLVGNNNYGPLFIQFNNNGKFSWIGFIEEDMITNGEWSLSNDNTISLLFLEGFSGYENWERWNVEILSITGQTLELNMQGEWFVLKK